LVGIISTGGNVTDDAAFLRAICEAPFDDGPRLVYADALDERSDPRGEFIRVQCELARLEESGWRAEAMTGRCRDEADFGDQRDALRRREQELLSAHYPDWVDPVMRAMGFSEDEPGDPVVTPQCFRRGLVAAFTLTTTQFLGDPCERCEEERRHARRYAREGQHTAAAIRLAAAAHCPACHGKGRVGGVAAALFRAAPVTEVRLSDKRPDTASDSWCWWRPSEACADCHHLPHEICNLLPGEGGFLYDTEADALSASSAACVALGRARANLPALARPVSADFFR
jgi:uncharacterized protein (TIGR02996 family)